MVRTKARVRTVSASFRAPIGVWETMLRLMDEHRLWARPTNYIVEAIHEKNQRHLAATREREKEAREEEERKKA